MLQIIKYLGLQDDLWQLQFTIRQINLAVPFKLFYLNFAILHSMHDETHYLFYANAFTKLHFMYMTLFKFKIDTILVQINVLWWISRYTMDISYLIRSSKVK